MRRLVKWWLKKDVRSRDAISTWTFFFAFVSLIAITITVRALSNSPDASLWVLFTPLVVGLIARMIYVWPGGGGL